MLAARRKPSGSSILARVETGSRHVEPTNEECPWQISYCRPSAGSLDCHQIHLVVQRPERHPQPAFSRLPLERIPDQQILQPSPFGRFLPRSLRRARRWAEGDIRIFRSPVESGDDALGKLVQFPLRALRVLRGESLSADWFGPDANAISIEDR
jgi:hypothetical protein